MRKTQMIISVEAQEDLLNMKLKLGFITQQEYDEQIKNLKPKSVGCLVG